MNWSIDQEEQLQAMLQVMASSGIENAAAGLSDMIGHKISVSVPEVSVVPIRTVPDRVGGAEELVVGTYLGCEGELGGHVMQIMEYQDALQLVDMILEQPLGQTRELDPLARSALGEAGNLTASFFLNAIAGTLGLSSRPTPPAVIVDMAGAILDIMLVTAGQSGDDVLLLEAVFSSEDRQLKLFFWMMPELEHLRSYLKAQS